MVSNVKDSIPFNRDAEKCLLGSLLLDESLIVEARKQLSSTDFFDSAHQGIVAAIFSAADHGESGLVAVKDILQDNGQLETIGQGTTERDGIDYLTGLLADYSFDATNFPYHVKAIRSASALRQLVALGGKMTADAKRSGVNDVDKLLGYYQDKLFLLDARAKHSGGLVEIGEAVDKAIRHADAVRGGTAAAGLATGFGPVDRASGGLQAGDLWILASPTSVGKTSLALAVAGNVARGGGRVLYVSLEMDRRAIANRVLSAEAKIPGLSLRTGNLDPVQEQSRVAAANEIRNWSLAIEDGAVSVSEISARARQLSFRWRESLSLIVVDFLQLLKPAGDERRTRAEQVSSIVWSLKSLGMKMGVPILALSQLSREGVKGGGPPSVFCLKESGSIENIGNTVLLLHRPDPAQFDSDGATILWGRLAKCRDGSVTAWPRQDGQGFRFRFLPEFTRLEALTL